MNIIRESSNHKFSYKLVQYEKSLQYLNDQVGSQTVELVYLNSTGELLGLSIRQSDRKAPMVSLADSDFPDNLVFIPLNLLGELGAVIYEALEVK